MLSVQPLLITDAAPSFNEQQAHRRRTYAILMALHVVGFTLSYPLYLWQPWAGLVAIALTGVLPWIAVLLANAPPRLAALSESRRARDIARSNTSTSPEAAAARSRLGPHNARPWRDDRCAFCVTGTEPD